MFVLETQRMLLRQFTAADGELLCKLDSDPEVMRFLTGGISTPREIIDTTILPGFLSSYERFPGFGVWAAVEKPSGEFLGWVSLRPREGAERPDKATLGYRLRRAVWGRGYATEGARALIRKGFAELGVRRVVATTYEFNVASRRVMEKVGMRLVRSFRLTPADLAQSATFAPGSLEVWDGDEVEYALEKADWERHQAISGDEE
jgi:RimJ/RimL family protein N-acetyltransferase